VRKNTVKPQIHEMKDSDCWNCCDTFVSPKF